MANRAYRSGMDPDRLSIEIEVVLTGDQLKSAWEWASANGSNPLAQEILAIWLKGVGARRSSTYEELKRRFNNGEFIFSYDYVPRSKAAAPSGTPSWRSVLGVAGLSREQITKAYRRLSKENHQNADTNSAAKEERQKTLNIAKDQAFREVLT